MSNKEIATGLDIGSSGIKLVVGRHRGETIEIITAGKVPLYRAMQRGMPIDLEKVGEGIPRALEIAENYLKEKKIKLEIASCYVSIKGNHLESGSATGATTISRSERGITRQDKEKALDAAQATLPIPPESQIIHVIPKQYTVNNQEGISNPVGMAGGNLSVDVHVITGNNDAIENITRCVNKGGLGVEDWVASAYANSLALLSSEEKDAGIALIDFGAQTIDVAIFVEGSFHWMGEIPVGAEDLTNDISRGLHTSLPEAQKIKHQYVSALPNKREGKKRINFTLLNGENKSIELQDLEEIALPRIEETASLIIESIQKSNYADHIRACALTGGGALLHGLVPFITNSLQIPSYLASLKNCAGIEQLPDALIYSTAAGLVKYAFQGRPGIRNLRRSRKQFQWLKKIRSIFDDLF